MEVEIWLENTRYEAKKKRILCLLTIDHFNAETHLRDLSFAPSDPQNVFRTIRIS